MTRSAFAALAILVGSQACVMASPYYMPAYTRSPEPLDDRLRIRVTTLTHYDAAAEEVQSAASAERREGRLIWADADGIQLYSRKLNRRVAIPASSIAGIEVYRERKGSAKAAAEGGATGAIAGAALGGLLGLVSEAAFGGLRVGGRDYSDAIGDGALAGALTGGTIGAVAGATAGEEVWEVVTLRELREELCRCRIEEPVVTVDEGTGED
jgi:hypothetical protein